ncbi:hypothetical protein ACTXMW_11735, partial [Brachybacterium paraconglomeratum]|uniref:hypothetical protein n=1 Tax=Brachybacterium paraconglomeratum TaxID=173362 RepID=UPI003FCF6020
LRIPVEMHHSMRGIACIPPTGSDALFRRKIEPPDLSRSGTVPAECLPHGAYVLNDCLDWFRRGVEAGIVDRSGHKVPANQKSCQDIDPASLDLSIITHSGAEQCRDDVAGTHPVVGSSIEHGLFDLVWRRSRPLIQGLGRCKPRSGRRAAAYVAVCACGDRGTEGELESPWCPGRDEHRVAAVGTRESECQYTVRGKR